MSAAVISGNSLVACQLQTLGLCAVSRICRYYEGAMGHSQFPGVLVSEATASAQGQSRVEPAHCQPTRRRKVFYLLDSLNIGGTEGQPVELATRLNPERYDVRLVRPHDLYANLPGIPAAAIARVRVIISSQRDLGHLDFYKSKRRMCLRRLQKLSTAVLTNAVALGRRRNGRACVSAELNFQRRIEKTDRVCTELLHSRGAE